MIQYYDLQNRRRSESIDCFFPGWKPGGETVVFLVPHDDDAVLGPGYLMQAVQDNGGRVGVVLFCNGCAGYSKRELMNEIVEIRRREMAACMALMDVPPDMLERLELPDFSSHLHVGWQLLNGAAGTFEILVRRLRAWKATRLVYANGYREHIDHLAVETAALYDGPQVGDPVALDLGQPSLIRSYASYCCWGRFSPLDALADGRDPRIRANWAIVADQAVENRLMRAIRAFASQGEIIQGIMETRKQRILPGDKPRYLEYYLKTEVRPPVEHDPYKDLVQSIDRRYA